MHREAHHVVVAAVDLLHEGAGKALDTVAARLIHGFAAVHVLLDGRGAQRAELYLGHLVKEHRG
eukprot:CAMPEP_0118843362 /NCGR_PEP_ID=MMETSP1162-20130426/82344_1 /TAXON_ID=33656 /ORGANISM="Phaeocystis Sp, Strain CCMP2710" /LENGTH=63 /DNA_ID=CAMNT_0006775457 /DNA_START=200 /DNA_END=387 /DNA_ORIENTATION=+